MSVEAFFELVKTFGRGADAVGKALAQRLDVPYHTDRVEQRLGHYMQREPNVWRSRRLEPNENLLPEALYQHGDEVFSETEFVRRGCKGSKITEEVWTDDHSPDSYNNVPEAVRKLPNGITGVYYHGRSMNLILLAPNGEKVGIRVVSLQSGSAALLNLTKAQSV